MEWKRALDRYGALIEERLGKYLAGALKDARIYHPFIEKVYSNIEEFMLRKGKRLASCSTLLMHACTVTTRNRFFTLLNLTGNSRTQLFSGYE